MKKIKVLVVSMAFAIAIIGAIVPGASAFAGKSNEFSVTGWVTNTDPPPACISLNCANTNGVFCGYQSSTCSGVTYTGPKQ